MNMEYVWIPVINSKFKTCKNIENWINELIKDYLEKWKWIMTSFWTTINYYTIKALLTNTKLKDRIKIFIPCKIDYLLKLYLKQASEWKLTLMQVNMISNQIIGILTLCPENVVQLINSDLANPTNFIDITNDFIIKGSAFVHIISNWSSLNLENILNVTQQAAKTFKLTSFDHENTSKN